MLKGIDIILYEKTKTGEDGFHDPIYEESPVTAHNWTKWVSVIN